MNDAAIGIFDSGVGGLTVARAVLDQLPHEPVRYVGDTARGPYGPRPLAEVRSFSLEIMDRLVADGVKLLVIACNSASAATLRDARERYDVPVVEVVHPAVRRAVAATRSGQVGVIGTQATITSGAYDDAFMAVPNITVTSVACPRFVEFVESGITSGPELLAAAEEYLAPMREADVDTLVLGCTHYPLLVPVLKRMFAKVRLVDSASTCAAHVKRTLEAEGLVRTAKGKPTLDIHLTDYSEQFEALALRFLGTEFGRIKKAVL